MNKTHHVHEVLWINYLRCRGVSIRARSCRHRTLTCQCSWGLARIMTEKQANSGGVSVHGIIYDLYYVTVRPR